MHTRVASEHAGVHRPLAPLGHAETDREALGEAARPGHGGEAMSLLGDAWSRAPEVRLLPHRVTTHRVRP